MFDNKTLLITGGTGSFANAVLKRFLNTGIAEIRIFSRDGKKQDDMRKRINHAKLKFYIGKGRDARSVAQTMRPNLLGNENMLEADAGIGVQRAWGAGSVMPWLDSTSGNGVKCAAY